MPERKLGRISYYIINKFMSFRNQGLFEEIGFRGITIELQVNWNDNSGGGLKPA